MSSKPSKAERKEDRIQQLEKELAETRKKLSASSKTVQLDDEQIDAFLDKLTDRIEWSTNRIVDDTNTTPINNKRTEKGRCLFNRFEKCFICTILWFRNCNYHRYYKKLEYILDWRSK